MGNCCTFYGVKTARSRTSPVYLSKVVVAIREYDYVGHQVGLAKITFRLPRPIRTSSQQHSLALRNMWTSLCMLPGIDPRGDLKKPCQDLCFVKPLGPGLLFVLYDGHGPSGHEVAEFCQLATLKYCEDYETDALAEPQEFLLELTASVDQQLLESSDEIDIDGSGATQVLVFLLGSKMYCASVGDSRAILATSRPEARTPTRLGTVELPMHLHALQLTEDQKPEQPEERERILQAGGRVEQLKDEWGHGIGSYRVWQSDADFPGLAMSRSLGDAAAKSVGVIATPKTSECSCKFGNDFFLVLASDGLWDVMDNLEVVSFVQFYRHKCLRGTGLSSRSQATHPQNTCIAHLLCEEARNRWLRLVEEEDVPIDDISCIVVEFDEGPESPAEMWERHAPAVPARLRRATTLHTESVMERNRSKTYSRSPTLQEINN